MNCTCAELVPCEKHKDKPLTIPEVVNHHSFVVRIYRRTSTKRYFSQVTRDAIGIKQSQDFDTKDECIKAVKL